MKKKLLLILVVLGSLLLLTGCTNGKTGSNTNHKIYKYMKISHSTTSGILNTAYLFEDPSVVGYEDTDYKPCLVAEFDTSTGKATSVKYYAFFLDYTPSTTWADKALDKYNNFNGTYTDAFTNVKVGRVNDSVTYITADVDPSSYVFNQYVDMLIKGQDIEDYENKVYYDRLDNYSTEPGVAKGDNYFVESLEGIFIEWSDSEIKAF